MRAVEWALPVAIAPVLSTKGENPTHGDCVKTLRMRWSFEAEDLDNSSFVNSQVGKGAVVSLKVR